MFNGEIIFDKFSVFQIVVVSFQLKRTSAFFLNGFYESIAQFNDSNNRTTRNWTANLKAPIITDDIVHL